ncbi:MAG: response regulator [Promethearchaeota archaeon]
MILYYSSERKYNSHLKARTINKGKILVVDDEPDIRLIIRLYLEQKGFTVIEATDGLSALRILDADENKEITLVITDYLMPRINGKDLCSEIKKNPKYKHVNHVFLITAHLPKDDFLKIKCFDAKFTKPLNFMNFLKQVETSYMVC